MVTLVPTQLSPDVQSFGVSLGSAGFKSFPVDQASREADWKLKRTVASILRFLGPENGFNSLRKLPT